MKDSAEFLLIPNCSEIENVIYKSDQFFKSLGVSKKIANEQMMIIDELLKFGSTFGDSRLIKEPIKVQINIDKKSIVIEVSKSIDGIEVEQLDRLDETIQFIRGFQDPFEAFRKIKSHHYTQRCNDDYDLRLAKIAYMGKAIVDFFINEYNVINLSAVRNF